VSNVDETVFALLGSGTAAGKLTSVVPPVGSGAASRVWTVIIGDISGQGMLRLDVYPSGGHWVTDQWGNQLEDNFTDGQTISVVHSAPIAITPAQPGIVGTDGMHIVARKPQVLETCTLIGCESASANLSIQRSDRRAPDFDVVLDINDRKITCHAPEPAENPYALPIDCADGVSIVVHEIVGCTASDCPPPGTFEELVHVHGDPEQLTISLWRGKQKIEEQTFFPKYQLDYPNGPRCGDPCKYWRTTWIAA
jgi:hypothetical protein